MIESEDILYCALLIIAIILGCVYLPLLIDLNNAIGELIIRWWLG